jgi:hypothetical protein
MNFSSCCESRPINYSQLWAFSGYQLSGAEKVFEVLFPSSSYLHAMTCCLYFRLPTYVCRKLNNCCRRTSQEMVAQNSFCLFTYIPTYIHSVAPAARLSACRLLWYHFASFGVTRLKYSPTNCCKPNGTMYVLVSWLAVFLADSSLLLCPADERRPTL